MKGTESQIAKEGEHERESGGKCCLQAMGNYMHARALDFWVKETKATTPPMAAASMLLGGTIWVPTRTLFCGISI